MYYKIIRILIPLVILQAVAIAAGAQSFTMGDVPLSWKDFEKRKDISSPYAAATHAQYNYKQKTIKRDGREYLRFQLKAYTDGSWVKSRFMAEALDSAKQRLLDHERGHLMILMVRLKRVQRVIEKFTFSKRMKFETDSIFRANFRDLRKENDLYDTQTVHCLNTEQQQEWETRLLAELNLLYAGEQKLSLEFEAEAPVAH